METKKIDFKKLKEYLNSKYGDIYFNFNFYQNGIFQITATKQGLYYLSCNLFISVYKNDYNDKQIKKFLEEVNILDKIEIKKNKDDDEEAPF